MQRSCNEELDLAIASLSFLRTKEKISLRKKLDKLHDLIVLSIEELSFVVGRAIHTKLWNPAGIEKRLEQVYKIMHIYHIECCRFDALCYPELLRSMYDFPYMLFWRGNLQALSLPTVSIVGTRKPSITGAQETFTLARELAEKNICIVSGLAFGIDVSAHKGTLAANGKTVAVLASGVDSLTPFGNSRLGGTIIEQNGCVVSEYLPGEQARPWSFVQRNAIISALSRIVVIGEAPPDSGALITADFALEQNRELVFLRSAYEMDLHYQVNPEKKITHRVKSYIEDGAELVDCADAVSAILQSLPEKIDSNALFL